MSVIVDFIVVLDHYDKKTMEEVNRRLHEVDRDRHQQFRPLDMEQAGGTKFMRAEAWAAAFNHLPPGVVRGALADSDWAEPLEVFVLERSGDYGIDLHAKSIADLRLDRVDVSHASFSADEA